MTQAEEHFHQQMRRVNTTIPGVVRNFDSALQTCSVQPTIKLRRTTLEGATEDLELPTLHNVPLVFPFAVTAGFALTLPVRANDPCLLIFSQRCIDNWWLLGGIQPPETGQPGARHHDINDGFAILCAPPRPNVLGGWENNGIELRNTARNTRVTVYVDRVEIVAPDHVLIDTPLTHITGHLLVDGWIHSSGEYGDGGGEIVTPGKIQSTHNDVLDQVRSMEADRNIYDGHTHPEHDGGNTGTPTQQE